MMSSKFLMSSLLVLTCCVSSNCQTPPWKSQRVQQAQLQIEKQFGYLRLSLLLPSAFRKVTLTPTKQNPRSLIINGLHPIDAAYPGTDAIRKKALDKVKSGLLIYWPHMKSREGSLQYRYYQAIYKRDGVLCDGSFKAEKYFAKAIELTQLHRQKIYEALSLHGTPPSKSAKYNASDIKKSIRGYSHQQPQITCQKVEGIVYLYEIMLCFNKSGTVFVNCHKEPPYKDCRNNGKIIILPLDD